MQSRRSQRRRMLRRARLCVGNGRQNVTIRDASLRGMSIQAPAPPQHGTYVEVLDVGQPVVGRVVWAEGNRCGLQLQDNLEQSVLAAGAPADPQEGAAPAGAKVAVSGTRCATFDRSRHASRSVEFTTAVAVALCTSSALALFIYARLSALDADMLSAFTLR